jgi:hypothetical protein
MSTDGASQLHADEATEALRWFAYQHLPEQLREVSGPFSTLAHTMVATLQPGRQLVICLDLLVQAKDAAVRQAVADQDRTIQ